MRQCKQCGGTFIGGETLCTYCGEPLIQGAKRKEKKESSRQKENKARQNENAWDTSGFGEGFRNRRDSAPPPINMFRRRPLDSFIAIVLAFTLGTFGAHWFYLGNTSRGMWYAIFFWTGIPTILGLIDGVKLLAGAVHNDFY